MIGIAHHCGGGGRSVDRQRPDQLDGAEATLGSFRWIYLEMSFVELYDGQPLADTIVDELRTRGFELAGTGARRSAMDDRSRSTRCPRRNASDPERFGSDPSGFSD